MRAISMIAPAVLAETRYVDLVPEQIARSIAISEEEILDDLLYPGDHATAHTSDAEGLAPIPRRNLDNFG